MAAKPRKIAGIVPALTARTQFGQILRRVKQNREHFVVGRRGEPLAVILSVEDYLGSFAKPQPALDKVRVRAKKRGLGSLSLREINREIRAYRRERRSGTVKGRS